jgi:hypothetical protein
MEINYFSIPEIRKISLADLADPADPADFFAVIIIFSII